MRRLAEEVGPEWDPPKLARLSLLGTMGKWSLSKWRQ
jgi:hypothetical protein